MTTNELPRFLLDLLVAVPRAGDGVHGWLFKVARQLWPHRTRDEIISLLKATVDGCGRTVTDKEITDAVASAQSCAWQPNQNSYANSPAPVPKWPSVNHVQRGAVIRDNGGLADLWEVSPVRIEDSAQHTEAIIDALFPGNPLLCCGKSSSIFDTKPREAWRGELSSLQLIVPSPMSAVSGMTKDGRPSKHTLDNTGPRRFLVVEFDSGTLDEHAALLRHLAGRGPMVLAVHSGGKSLHGWFYHAGQTEEFLRRFFSYAVALGPDPATWTRSQFVRMPDGTERTATARPFIFSTPARSKYMQAISENWTMHPPEELPSTANGETWDNALPVRPSLATEYLPTPEEITAPLILPPTARPLSELIRHRTHDPNELLLHRFLCRLATLLLCGPTGIGKSALAMQMMILWSLAREAFGIKPAGPLKSLLVQAENDDGDQAEMRDGVFAGLDLNADEREHAGKSIIVAREDTRTGLDFLLKSVRPLLAEHKPDLLWLDPMLSFLGGESNSQKDVGGFLRNGLNPLLREFNCGCIEIHHTNKPASGREKPDWRAGDHAYLGSGSAEWANHARAVLALRSIGSHDVFELQAGKRGSRLGWNDADGQKAFAKYLAHAKEPGVICWREVSADDLDTGGRPKQFNADEVQELLPPEGLTAGDWKKAAEEELGIKGTSFHNLRRDLAKADRVIKSKASGKWQPVRKGA